MNDSREAKPTSIFEAARLGWNVKLTCWRCGHVRILEAAGIWLRTFRRGWPDDLEEVQRHGKCLPCLNDRHIIIRSPALELTRDPPTGDQFPQPTAQQWKEGLRWQRR